MDKQITFILPTKDNESHLNETIRSLIASTEYSFKLIILESNTKEFHELSYIKCLERDIKNEKYIKSKINPIELIIKKIPTNGINIKAINEGIKLTTDEDIILIHDDIIFFKLYKRDWLKNLTVLAELNPQAGMLTYLNNIKVSGKDYLEGLKYIGSWFCYIKREVINKIGLMDENFNIGEDIDYSYRVQKEGYSLGELDFWFQHHQIRETPHNPQSEEIKRKAELYFKKKHNLK